MKQLRVYMIGSILTALAIGYDSRGQSWGLSTMLAVLLWPMSCAYYAGYLLHSFLSGLFRPEKPRTEPEHEANATDTLAGWEPSEVDFSTLGPYGTGGEQMTWRSES